MCLRRCVISTGGVCLGETMMGMLHGTRPCPLLVPLQCGQKKRKKFELSSDDWDFLGVLKGSMQQIKIYA